MPGFSEDSAKRIARSVRYTERLQGVPSTDPNENYGAASGNQICLVQTGPTLPAGYNGAMGAPGQVVEKQADGTINKLGAIWLKDINGGTLSASTIYQARIGGTWTQDVTTNGIVKPTTLGLYLVQLPTIALEEDHFKPGYSIPYFPDPATRFFYNGVYYQIIGGPNVVVTTYNGLQFSDFAYGSYNISNLRCFIRKTKKTFSFQNTTYTIYEWYSSDVFLVTPIAIRYNYALKPDGSFYNVSVINPAIYLQTYGVSFNTFSGFYHCIYRISRNYNYSQFDDQLLAVAKVADFPTTGGIGSGIGSGISGV